MKQLDGSQKGSSLYNGMIFAEKLFLFQATSQSDVANAVINMQLFLFQTATDQNIDSIKNIFIVPDYCIDASALIQHFKTSGNETCTYYTLKYSTNVPQTNLKAPFSTYNTYRPKNNKCYVYPYHYLLATNNNGSQNIYKYENFSDIQNPNFTISVAIMPRL